MIFIISMTTTLVAQATIECKGQKEPVSMSLLDLSTRPALEGEAHPVAVRVTESRTNANGVTSESVLFAGTVKAIKEDVQWFLASRNKKSLKATVFLDELNDVSVSVNGREINFNCEQ